MSVVEFRPRAKKEENYKEGDAITGWVRCRGCQHRWMGQSPPGVIEFQCPECLTFKGIRDTFSGPEEFYECCCGCDVFTFSRKNVYCANCGLYHEPWKEL